MGRKLGGNLHAAGAEDVADGLDESAGGFHIEGSTQLEGFFLVLGRFWPLQIGHGRAPCEDAVGCPADDDFRISRNDLGNL